VLALSTGPAPLCPQHHASHRSLGDLREVVFWTMSPERCCDPSSACARVGVNESDEEGSARAERRLCSDANHCRRIRAL